ncbi:MAG: macro domain-containing protein [Anaerolineae bacterium]|jgi:O-acetyl-ADP-ribose deacetylase (regulator of RNase III)
MRITINQVTLELVEGDITQLDTDAIVNAANERLAHGGGVAGVIARQGGPTIQRESTQWVREHGPVPTGGAAITSGGDLRARYVIHAVGPIYNATDRPAELLRSAVVSALEIADEHDLSSIALPAISTGIFGYPIAEAAEVMLRAAIDYLSGETGLERVVFCLYGQSAYDTFQQVLSGLRPS